MRDPFPSLPEITQGFLGAGARMGGQKEPPNRFSTVDRLRLIKRAIREGWPTDPEKAQVELEWVRSLITDEGHTDRISLAAVWVVLTAEQCSLPPRPRGRPRSRAKRA
jgi:hypothetical protein